ncbi:MAG: hypothetical protein NT001_05000 [Candidatus Woesearchaeota archaeon]|nr:hypothetical protein [Candidatus Woesearchaeota archaeon]
MSFKDNIKDSLKILTFDETSLTNVSNNTSATGYGFLTLVIAGIAIGISMLNLFSIILNPIVLIIGLFIGYSIFHFIAKFILGGQATGAQYFRALSNSFVIYWFTFIPFLGWILQSIAGFWLLAINIYILNKVHKLSMVKAVILGLLPGVIVIVLVIIGAIAYFGMFSPSALLASR